MGMSRKVGYTTSIGTKTKSILTILRRCRPNSFKALALSLPGVISKAALSEFFIDSGVPGCVIVCVCV